MSYISERCRAEDVRIQDITERHIRSLMVGLPHPKATQNQKSLAARRIQDSVDRQFKESTCRVNPSTQHLC